MGWAYLCVEHLALGAQAIALLHEAVELLSSLQHALNGLVQHDLGLIQFLLDLHDAVGLLRVLVLDNVFLELGVRARGIGGGEDIARVLVQELVDDFGEELVGNEGGVFVVGDDDAGDTLGAAVRVEGVR